MDYGLKEILTRFYEKDEENVGYRWVGWMVTWKLGNRRGLVEENWHDRERGSWDMRYSRTEDLNNLQRKFFKEVLKYQ